ncbi:exopolysaccharide biosynthesis polyprenyl glycosylphosphotransferase [Qipengyuania marisflavi]|uniref:Exopolysaccharide biosynthesis polyprenyl glycosylphosphotransferase n=1 Tax=Qipengyuania marisflavi TaxID=2486356 RepID=A0A5S3P9M5_9SPHN|nr:exopolysaccharide biosynthesis polyprenyl glycosylphosphotransferase [Qipengyuania marisflavi]TMM50161.1 exopolysaccharide biosynthesis polyprenyl glycosylphosphotransferase [Qipengyuania marisflavi]
MLERSTNPVTAYRPMAMSLEKRRIAVHLVTMAVDAAIIVASFQLAAALYIGVFPSSFAFSQTNMFVPIFAVLALYNSAYSVESLLSLRLSVARVVSAALLTAAMLIFITYFMDATGRLSRGLLTLGITAACAMMTLFRGILHTDILWRVVPDINSVLVIRDGGPEIEIPKAIVIDVADHDLDVSVDDPASLNRFGEHVQNVDRVVVSCPVEKRATWAFVMRAAGVDGEIVSHALRELRPIALRRDGNFISLVVSSRPLGFRQRVMKRAMDFVLSGLALVVLSPIFLLIAIAIKIDDPGPVFFIQRRMGRGNRFFDMLKFRSMKVQKLDHEGARSASKDDDRITRVGKFLRKTSLDEIPQLVNVVMGDMSLVGPRPHALGSLAGDRLFWEVESNYWRRHSLKPGLTGLAQIRGLRGATDEEQHLTKRLDSDLEYIANWSPWRDLWIMLMTVRVLVHDRAF